MGELVVRVLGHDVVSQETGLARTGVGDQRLVFGQFQLELVTQESPQEMLDLRCFDLRSTESEEKESRRGGSRPPPLAEPCVNLSAYTAPIVQPPGLSPKRQ